LTGHARHRIIGFEHRWIRLALQTAGRDCRGCWEMKTALKKILGVILIILGLVALLTPLSPGSWLALVGLEILGLRLVLQRRFMSLLPRRWSERINRFIAKSRFFADKQYPDDADHNNSAQP